MSDEHRKPPYEFFVDGKEFKTDRASLTGLEIKTLAGVPGEYQLFLEERGDTPDRAISDGDSLLMNEEHIKHFFAVPPATFG